MDKKGFKVFFRVILVILIFSCSQGVLAVSCSGGINPEECGGELEGEDWKKSYVEIFPVRFLAIVDNGIGTVASSPTFPNSADYPLVLSNYFLTPNPIIDYLASDGIRYVQSIMGVPIYNCDGDNAVNCVDVPGVVNGIEPLSHADPRLCALEGDYYVTFYTGESKNRLLPDSSPSGLYSGAMTKAYTINAQDSEDICACIKNGPKPDGTGYYNDFNYDATSNGFKKYSWSPTYTSGSQCCGAKDNGGATTICKWNSQYLCDLPPAPGTTAYTWRVAEASNIGCAYDTSCGYWILNKDSSWLQCSASTGNNPNFASVNHDPDRTPVYSSFACFNTAVDAEQFKIYECKPGGVSACGVAVSPVSEAESRTAGGSNGVINPDAYVTTGVGTIYYCLTNGSFTNELDGPSSGDPIDYEFLQKTCYADFGPDAWTGSKCCGDFDPDESYNDDAAEPYPVDLGRKAGCFKGVFVSSGKTLKGTGKFDPNLISKAPYNTDSIINYNGTFYGCNLTITNLTGTGAFNINDVYSAAEDKRIIRGENDFGDSTYTYGDARKNLFTNYKSCDMLLNATPSNPSYSYYCSMKNIWEKQDNTAVTRMHPSLVRTDLVGKTGQRQYECCDVRRCFNGTECIQNLNDATPFNKAVQHGDDPNEEYACVMMQDGATQWQPFSGIKNVWDGDPTRQGSCAFSSQCLVDNTGSFALHSSQDYYDKQNGVPGAVKNPHCIDDGDYIFGTYADEYNNDHYCDNGNWTSRIKLVANQMLNGITGDYSLFCDNATNTLNTIDYAVAGDKLVSNYFINMTNVCVLNAAGSMEFGMALRNPIENSGIFSILGVANNYCQGVVGGNSYQACLNDGLWKIYYNPVTRSVIFSKDVLTLNVPAQSFENKFLTASFVNKIHDISIGTSNAMTFVNKTHDYARMFIFQKGASPVKKIFALREQVYDEDKNSPSFNDYILVRYTGFNTDICKYADFYASGSVSSDYCRIEQPNNYIFAFNYGDGGKLVDAWSDLTAKLRLS